MQEQNQRLTSGWQAVYQWDEKRSFSRLLSRGPSPVCHCKPFSCKACPGKNDGAQTLTGVENVPRRIAMLPGHALHGTGLQNQMGPGILVSIGERRKFAVQLKICESTNCTLRAWVLQWFKWVLLSWSQKQTRKPIFQCLANKNDSIVWLVDIGLLASRILIRGLSRKPNTMKTCWDIWSRTPTHKSATFGLITKIWFWQLVESKTRTYHGQVGLGRMAGRRGGVEQDWVQKELFAQETSVPCTPQGIEETCHRNFTPEAQTSEILFKPNAGTKPELDPRPITTSFAVFPVYSLNPSKRWRASHRAQQCFADKPCMKWMINFQWLLVYLSASGDEKRLLSCWRTVNQAVVKRGFGSSSGTIGFENCRKTLFLWRTTSSSFCANCPRPATPSCNGPPLNNLPAVSSGFKMGVNIFSLFFASHPTLYILSFYTWSPAFPKNVDCKCSCP